MSEPKMPTAQQIRHWLLVTPVPDPPDEILANDKWLVDWFMYNCTPKQKGGKKEKT